MSGFLILVRNEIKMSSGPADGGHYDLTAACPRCGAGARRTSPLFLSRSKLSDKVGATWKIQIIIPPRLVGAIEKVAPESLGPIVDLKTKEVLPHRHLIY